MDISSRVVITGIGAICASGKTPDEVFESLSHQSTCITELQNVDPSAWPCHTGGSVSIRSRDLLNDRKLLKLLKKTDVLGIYSAEQAMACSRILDYRGSLNSGDKASFSERFGLYVGTSGASYNMQHDFLSLICAANEDMNKFGSRLDEFVSPMWLLYNLPNNVLCHVGIRNNLKGPNCCITNQGTSGMLAIIEALEAIRAGDADRAIAVGHDVPTDPQNLLYYQSVGLLSDSALTPFTSNSSGTILGEGGAALMLESLEAAISRSAVIYAEILGKGCTSEAQGLLPVRRDGDGLARAIALALDESGLRPQEIGMIVCHGNGTKASDHSEAAAIRTIFGLNPPPITSFKWAFGHTLAASGCIDTVISTLALRRKLVPPIPMPHSVEPSLKDLPIAIAPMEPISDVSLIISRGFGGQNTTLIIRAYY